MEEKLIQNKIYSNMKYKEKYKDLYKGGKYKIKEDDGTWRVKSDGYGNGGGWKTILLTAQKYVAKNPGTFILDYGCGSAIHWHRGVGIFNGKRYVPKGKNIPIKYDFMTMGEWLGPNVSGYYRYDPYHPIYNIRPPKIKFTLTVLTDVIEHIPIKELPEVLTDIANLTSIDGAILLSIPKSPSAAYFLDGENMHCTLMPEEEWKKIIRKHIPKHTIITNWTN